MLQDYLANLLRKQDGKCKYCGCPIVKYRRSIGRMSRFGNLIIKPDGTTIRAATIDHVIPRSKGGTNDYHNLVACCQPCNEQKGDNEWV